MLHATRSFSKSDRSVLTALPQPVAMGPRHRPIHHAALVDAVSERYGEPNRILLSADRARLYATWPIGDEDGSFGYVPELLLRHDNAQREALSLALGATVLICTNGMVIQREIDASARRRHTTRFNWREWLQEELNAMRPEAVANGVHRLAGLPMTGPRFGEILLTLAVDDVIPRRTAADAWEAWKNPPHDEFRGPNAWCAYNALNHALKTVATSRQDTALAVAFDTLSRLN